MLTDETEAALHLRANAYGLALTCAVARLRVMRPRRVVPAMLQTPNACSSACAGASTCSRQRHAACQPQGWRLSTIWRKSSASCRCLRPAGLLLSRLTNLNRHKVPSRKLVQCHATAVNKRLGGSLACCRGAVVVPVAACALAA